MVLICKSDWKSTFLTLQTFLFSFLVGYSFIFSFGVLGIVKDWLWAQTVRWWSRCIAVLSYGVVVVEPGGVTSAAGEKANVDVSGEQQPLSSPSISIWLLSLLTAGLSYCRIDTWKQIHFKLSRASVHRWPRRCFSR